MFLVNAIIVNVFTHFSLHFNWNTNIYSWIMSWKIHIEIHSSLSQFESIFFKNVFSFPEFVHSDFIAFSLRLKITVHLMLTIWKRNSLCNSFVMFFPRFFLSFVLTIWIDAFRSNWNTVWVRTKTSFLHPSMYMRISGKLMWWPQIRWYLFTFLCTWKKIPERYNLTFTNNTKHLPS